MKYLSKLKKVVFNKNILHLAGIFSLAGTELYGGIMPFGLPAFVSWNASPFSALVYISGVIVSGMGFVSYLRHVFSLLLFLIAKKVLKEKIPDCLLVASSVLLSGALSLILLNEGRLIYFAFAFAEAIFSMIFTFIFKKAENIWFEKMCGKTVTETEFAFMIITLMCLVLSFSGIESGRISISATLMILIGMTSAFVQRAPVSAAVNMAAGFFSMIFTPANIASVAYLTLSGFAAAILKKYGKFAVPMTYMLLFPLFSAFRVNVTTFYIEDMIISSALFLILPGRILNAIDTVPDGYTGRETSVILSDRLMSLAETFCSVPAVFSGIDARTKDMGAKEVSSVTVENVCRECVLKGGCSKRAEEILKRSETGKMMGDDLKCIRKKELITAFKNNLRLYRMEDMLKNYIKEENAALSGQMECIGRTLKELTSEKESNVLRDSVAEREIKAVLKKSGIYVKKICAGRNSKGVFNVSLELIPCREGELCERKIPELLRDVLGFEVVKYGMKGCESCRVNYTEIPVFRPEKGVASVACEEISGDSFAFAYTDREHFAVILSDGMGTGARARYKSEAATELTTKLLSAGMNLPSSLSMVNSLLLRQGGRDFVTLDIALIDIVTGVVSFTKNASATGYLLKCGGRVIRLESTGNPVGILGKTETEVNEIHMHEGDFLILVSDGAAECFKGGEEELGEKIGEFTGGSAQNLSDFILAEAIKAGGKKIKDDITVVAVGCIKKQKCGKAIKKGGLVYEKRQESNYFRQY